MITKQQLDFVSRLKHLDTQFLEFRSAAKSLKEEFNELSMATAFDAADWNGDNVELGAHQFISVQQIFECLAALDAGENALVQGGHVAALLRMKE